MNGIKFYPSSWGRYIRAVREVRDITDLLYLEVGDNPGPGGGGDTHVDTGAADLSIAEPPPIGFGLPNHPHEETE